MTRSGSGCPAVYRCSAMCSTSRISASSSIVVPLVAVVQQQRPDRVGDLAPAAVADGDVHQQAAVPGGGLGGILEHLRGVGGQQVQRAHRLHVPLLGHQLADGVLDDPQQRLELVRLPGQVVGGQQPQRDDLDAGLLAPVEQLEDLVRARLMTAADVGQARRPRPPAVTVAHHPDVTRYRLTAPASPRACARRAGRRDRAIPSGTLPRCRHSGIATLPGCFPARWPDGRSVARTLGDASLPAETAVPADSALSVSVRTVSKNATSSAEVRTARTPTPPVPQASMTARRVSRQLPGPPAGGRTAATRREGCPVPMHSPSQTALDRSTQRSSPVPGRSARSRARSVKYSWSPGR